MKKTQMIYLARRYCDNLDISFCDPEVWSNYFSMKRPENKNAEALSLLWSWTKNNITIQECFDALKDRDILTECHDLLLNILDEPNDRQKQLYDAIVDGSNKEAKRVNNLYLVSRTDIYSDQWDYYSSFVVCCSTEDEARETHPSDDLMKYIKDRLVWGDYRTKNVRYFGNSKKNNQGWVLGKDICHLTVTLIGTASKTTERGIILSEFVRG